MPDPRPVIPYQPAGAPAVSPPPAPPAASPSTPPLSRAALTPDQLRDLELARKRFKLIRRAIRVGATDGATLAFCAALTLLGSVFGMGGLLVGIALAAIAAFELHATRKLKALDLRAPAWLAYNQLALAGALILYGLYNLIFPAPLPPDIAANAAQLKDLGFDAAALESQLHTALYASLIAIALLVQGSMAFFYYRRKPMLTAYLTQTPDWIRQLQSTGIEL